MIVLGIETSTPRASVALVDQERVIAAASLGVDRRHGEFLGPALDFCLREAGLTPDSVTGLAVGIGPGLFTGLRVGVAFAQAFAAARQLPVVPLAGLDVLAFQARHVRRPVAVAVDARRDEIFWALYRWAPGGIQRESDLHVGPPGRLAAEIEGSGEEFTVVGDGAVRYRETFEDVGAEVTGYDLAWPVAEQLARLALPRFEREETIRPYALQPVYLRQADAAIGWKRRGRLRGGA